MPSWAVVCTNCSEKVTHSTVTATKLADFLLPPKPEVPESATITCTKCQTIVPYVRTDLRYIASSHLSLEKNRQQ